MNLLRIINRIFFRIPGKIFYSLKRILKLSYRIFIFKFILVYDYFSSKWFHNKDTFEVFDGNTSSKNSNLCIFSHYDLNNIIDPYVIFYLQELTRNNCDIVFVTSSFLSLSERNKISPYCKQIIIRRNRGRDFGSFKCGILNSKLSQYEKVILANDSVYGPFFDIAEILRYGDQHNLDMWGASDSLEKNYHIQSYFVLFNKKIINNPVFMKFWEKVYYLGQRQSIINHYELGMSKYFQKYGFKLGAFCNYLAIQNDLFSQADLMNKLDKKIQKLLKKRRVVNQTHAFWNIIITKYRFPFLKRELLLHNPEALNIYQWEELLQTHSAFEVDLITNHLLRLSTRV